jgi:hypothetical protein
LSKKGIGDYPKIRVSSKRWPRMQLEVVGIVCVVSIAMLGHVIDNFEVIQTTNEEILEPTFQLRFIMSKNTGKLPRGNEKHENLLFAKCGQRSENVLGKRGII